MGAALAPCIPRLGSAGLRYHPTLLRSFESCADLESARPNAFIAWSFHICDDLIVDATDASIAL